MNEMQLLCVMFENCIPALIIEINCMLSPLQVSALGGREEEESEKNTAKRMEGARDERRRREELAGKHTEKHSKRRAGRKFVAPAILDSAKPGSALPTGWVVTHSFAPTHFY